MIIYFGHTSGIVMGMHKSFYAHESMNEVEDSQCHGLTDSLDSRCLLDVVCIVDVELCGGQDGRFWQKISRMWRIFGIRLHGVESLPCVAR
jgi:hypothetical protein